MKQAFYCFLSSLSLFISCEITHAQSIYLKPTYDTIRATYFTQEFANHDISFNQFCDITFEVIGSKNFELFVQVSRYGRTAPDTSFRVPANTPVTIGSVYDYIYVNWTASRDTEHAMLRLSSATDTESAYITAIPYPPAGFLFNPFGLRWPSIAVGTTSCQDLHVLNYTGQPKTISHFMLTGAYYSGTDRYAGIACSLSNPPSLPITIKNNDSITLSVCYQAIAGHSSDEDSLLFIGPDGHYMGIVDLLGSTASASVSDLQKPEVQLYPNPATNHVTVSGLTSLHEMVVIQDNLGRTVQIRTIDQEPLEFDVSTFLPGLYSVLLPTGERRRFMKL